LWERRNEYPGAVLVRACHDETVAEVDIDQAEEAKEWLEKAMVEGIEVVLNGTDEVHIAVKLEARIARSWGDRS
jgi:DNA polymerase I-like protein with 3'-5' exonuclease and polymerase domains